MMSTIEAPPVINQGQLMQERPEEMHFKRIRLGLGTAALEEVGTIQPRKIEAAVQAFRLVRNRRP